MSAIISWYYDIGELVASWQSYLSWNMNSWLSIDRVNFDLLSNIAKQCIKVHVHSFLWSNFWKEKWVLFGAIKGI